MAMLSTGHTVSEQEKLQLHVFQVTTSTLLSVEQTVQNNLDLLLWNKGMWLVIFLPVNFVRSGRRLGSFQMI